MKKLFQTILFSIALLTFFGVSATAQINQAQPKYLGKRAVAPTSCTTTGAYYFSTSDKEYSYCTAVGTPGTWERLGKVAPNSTALRFDGTRVAPDGHNVNHGSFWEVGTNYGDSNWDMLVRPFQPNQPAGYFLSAGYTASHVILIGYESDSVNFRLTGNMYINGGLIAFGTTTKFKLGEWYHIAVVRDGSAIKVYVNGLAESSTNAAGFRTVPSTLEANLYVGGSDHSNASFDLAWIRGVEGNSVIENVGLNQGYVPQRFPLSTFYQGTVQGAVISANFLADYTIPSILIPDHSNGLNGKKHAGILSVGLGGQVGLDADLPKFVPAVISQAVRNDVITVPGTAKIYDSFSNKDKTPFWNKTFGLGNTEGGTLGVKTWANSTNFAISQGWAQPSGYTSGITTVTYNSADYDIRLNKSGGVTVIGNYVDASNYLSLYYGSDTQLVITKKIAGVDTQLFNGTVGTEQAVLRVVKSGVNIDVYSGANLVHQTTNATGLSSGALGFDLTTFHLGKVNEFAVY